MFNISFNSACKCLFLVMFLKKSSFQSINSIIRQGPLDYSKTMEKGVNFRTLIKVVYLILNLSHVYLGVSNAREVMFPAPKEEKKGEEENRYKVR